MNLDSRTDAESCRYLKAVPTGQLAEPEEVANIVSFLCQDMSENINGADILLEGGYTSR
jgi:NAD(P)-dependent dehydrogenase (short-subunit alcohol dehydrogenase family)